MKQIKNILIFSAFFVLSSLASIHAATDVPTTEQIQKLAREKQNKLTLEKFYTFLMNYFNNNREKYIEMFMQQGPQSFSEYQKSDQETVQILKQMLKENVKEYPDFKQRKENDIKRFQEYIKVRKQFEAEGKSFEEYRRYRARKRLEVRLKKLKNQFEEVKKIKPAASDIATNIIQGTQQGSEIYHGKLTNLYKQSVYNWLKEL